MGFLRIFSSTMARMSTFRSYQIVLLLAAALAVVAFYYFGSERHSFSSTTKRIRQSQASQNANRNDADLSLDTRPEHPEPMQADDTALRGDLSLDVVEYHVLMMFTKVDKSRTLQEKFRVAMKSMAKHGSFLDGEVIVLHFVSDEASRELGEKMLPELLIDATFLYQVVFHSVGSLTERLFPIVEVMQKHFSAGSGAYFSDAIFFLSVAMHRIMPAELERVVQLDLDLKFRSNIRDLFQEFSRFPPGAVIGIAPELQPVYRHMFWQYRKENPSSRVGAPPPEGQPGFNSGVMLLDLGAMRGSALYNGLLEPGRVGALAERYHFQGHLGDQDFFTVVGMAHPELFSPLACGWNRQLCTWWREHGYSDVFPLYYRCDGPVHIYHGNCNTSIPDD
ncbi:xyloside xylosyltransferase 1 isoform X1 [Conger conger]|uniref:xyloside xylosyltransferase 1 isoform X1 n=2 Tax=Conger conger TaxID=82655 RepID=UPI002A59D321|nr:xyloside xylosyltransferase 1 isoform X1 [Conger conger]XP_061095286.1 xyloside xylosyltransferase 1 isoform X1 [Conger conger]XP_061095287.1 xyloside xylosyltransferase 1 isoform X1 [Conger conger]XP_061095288.1 xyloside xylosyltransferase 1 isoform X1 [Conger conger]